MFKNSGVSEVYGDLLLFILYNMNYTQFWFISNTANFQPVSNLRFSIVVACECCLISKKSL